MSVKAERSFRTPVKLGLAGSIGAAAITTALGCSDGNGNAVSKEPDQLLPTAINTASSTNSNEIIPGDGIAADLSDAEILPANERAKEGKLAPNLELESLEGQKFELSELLGKKPILLISEGYVESDYENLTDAMAIKKFFGDELEVVALTLYTDASASPVEFPLHLATGDFVKNYTPEATQYYLIDSNGVVKYHAQKVFATPPHALIKGLLDYSRSPVDTNGAFSLPFDQNPEINTSNMFDILLDDLFSIGYSSDFSDDELIYMKGLLDEAGFHRRNAASSHLVPVYLANLGRAISERYCQAPNGQVLESILRNTASAAYQAYLEGVGNVRVDESLWDLLRYSFDTSCQNAITSQAIHYRELSDGSVDFGNGVIGPNRRDLESL